jgi:hypothetical protein
MGMKYFARDIAPGGETVSLKYFSEIFPAMEHETP